MLNIKADIENISYIPTLAESLDIYDVSSLDDALSKSCFRLTLDNNNEYAISTWVSPKRTRSYPYARVYHTLAYGGRKITLIPVIKDEGAAGDRDYVQWDTIALMSLLQVYVVLVYYVSAERNPRYENKITHQRICNKYLLSKLKEISEYKSDALHWNMKQAEDIASLFGKALECYDHIAEVNGVALHSNRLAEQRITRIIEDYTNFRKDSREKAQQAQHRESQTIQPKENVISVDKAKITIENYLKGVYYLTADEARISDNNISLLEAKHTKTANRLPSKDDILDGCVKMILFSNLVKVRIGDSNYQPQAILKLSNANGIHQSALNAANIDLLNRLRHEAATNNFHLVLE